jgi:hypothetical protein
LFELAARAPFVPFEAGRADAFSAVESPRAEAEARVEEVDGLVEEVDGLVEEAEGLVEEAEASVGDEGDSGKRARPAPLT